MRADGLNCLVTRVRVNLFHNAVKVVLNGEFRQVQLRGDFFVCETLGNESHELPLTEG